MSNEIPKRIPFSIMISKPSYQELINNSIKNPDRASRFISSIISAVSVNPALQECETSTILSGALLGESLNLSPSPQLGQYYLVPFENRKKGYKEAVFQIGYRGLLQLALRSGQYKHLNVLTVKKGELINWNPLTEEINLKIIDDDIEREKEKAIGYVASFEYLNGFVKTIYWSKNKMLLHANRYSPAFSIEPTKVKTKNATYNKVSFTDYEDGNYPEKDAWLYSSFWYKDFDMMAHKTILRQLISKWGVMSIDLQKAFDSDNSVLNDGEYIHVENTELPDIVMSEDRKSAEKEPEKKLEELSINDV